MTIRAVHLAGSAAFFTMILTGASANAQPSFSCAKVPAGDDRAMCAGTVVAQAGSSTPSAGGPARPASGLAAHVNLKVLVDSKANDDYLKKDTDFTYYVYGGRTSGETMKVELAAKQITGVWKGNDTIVERPFNQPGYIEDVSQFAPVFLVIDARNDGTSAARINSAFLEISDSMTDLQPYLEIGDWGRLGCGDGTYLPAFEMRNLGWGKVENASMTYTFGTATARSAPFTSKIDSFDFGTTASVESGLQNAKVKIERAKNGKFQCTSKAQLPACFSRLKDTGIFGNLADYVFREGTVVYSRVRGSFDYSWTGIDKQSNKRSSPFMLDIPLLHFELGGPECGAPGPADRDLKPITLSLDRKSYRLPLNWKGQLAARQNQRIGFSLIADKSSRHQFRVVLQLADGSTTASNPVDLSYFKPRFKAPD
jgi:hypothetical protein